MSLVVLVHGAVSDARVWDRVLPRLRLALPDFEVVAPTRPRTGEFAQEVAWLASIAADGWVVGMSGGATLGLGLTATGTPLLGAVLHEPAVGSLAPHLLAPVVHRFRVSGVAGLGRALYGDAWTPALSGDVREAVAGTELEMFRGFEPAAVSPTAGRVVVTYGRSSPAIRRTAAWALHPYGCEIQPVRRASHFAAYDHPAEFAEVVASVIAGSPRDPHASRWSGSARQRRVARQARR